MNLLTVWVDYRRTLIMYPTFRIIRCLTLYKVHPIIIRLIEFSMSKWKTNMTLFYSQRALET